MGSIRCIQMVSTADTAPRQTLPHQLVSPGEEGKRQERNNGRRDKEKGGKMEPKGKMGKMTEGGCESEIQRTVEERKKEGEFEAIVSCSSPLSHP